MSPDDHEVPLEHQTPESLIAYIRSLEKESEAFTDLLAVVRKRFPVDPYTGTRSSRYFKDVEILATLIGIDALYPERKA